MAASVLLFLRLLKVTTTGVGRPPARRALGVVTAARLVVEPLVLVLAGRVAAGLPLGVVTAALEFRLLVLGLGLFVRPLGIVRLDRFVPELAATGAAMMGGAALLVAGVTVVRRVAGVATEILQFEAPRHGVHAFVGFESPAALGVLLVMAAALHDLGLFLGRGTAAAGALLVLLVEFLGDRLVLAVRLALQL